jgi:hypothetical protein
LVAAERSIWICAGCTCTGWLQAEDENGQKMTDEELWEDVHDIMGAGAAATLVCIHLSYAMYCQGLDVAVIAASSRSTGSVLVWRRPRDNSYHHSGSAVLRGNASRGAGARVQ